MLRRLSPASFQQRVCLHLKSGTPYIHKLHPEEEARLHQAISSWHHNRRRGRWKSLRDWTLYGGGSAAITYLLLEKLK